MRKDDAVSTPPDRPLRKDAARNRDLLLAAANELIATRGTDVTLNDIAHHAGVGVGTAYRHFTDKHEVLQALLEQRIDQVHAIMTEAAQADDAYEALRDCIIKVGQLQASDRGMRQAISTAQGPEQRVSVRERLLPIGTELVERAKATGRLRAEFQHTDLPMILWTIGAISEYTGEVAPQLWRRYLDVLLDGFAAPDTEPRQPLTVDPPDLDQIDAIMQTWPSKR
jgi:AcrR family transcriptional regulator